MQKNTLIANVGVSSYKIIQKLFGNKKPYGFYFASLKLKDNKGILLDENLYWLTSKKSDWLELEGLNSANLQVAVTKNDNGLLHAVRSSSMERENIYSRILTKIT